MKKTINSRIRNDLFPEMPQSFADKLTAALKTDGALNADQRSADEAPIAPVIPEQPKRRFPFGKVFSGIAAAVLALLCIVIAVFGIILPNVQKTPGATRPDAYNPLRGRWTLTEVEQNGETVDPETIGLQMQLQFSDESVTVSTQTGGAEGQNVYRYAFADNAVELTAEGARIPVLPASGVYDPETNTLRFANEDGDGALRFTREPDLVGKWTLTRIGELDPAALGVQYAEWMEFSADGTVTVTELFNSDTNEETFAYTVYGKTVQIYTEGKETPEHMLIPEQLVYDRETDTLRQKESNVYDPDSGRQDELIFSRTPNAIVWHSLVGKWTLTGIELYGSTGSPETSGLEMYLEFSDKESVTVTTVKETGTDTQTYRWRFVSGNQIELTNKDYVTSSIPYTFLYDAATDTLRMDPDGYGLKGMLVFSRTPDAVIPEPERKEIAALRAKYPEYFGLDTESGLKVFVAEFACDSFSCTLLSGKDKDKTLLDISTMPGMTVGEMLSVLLTYDIPSEKIEVIPYVNPLSSYAYNIDALYTSYVTWKIKGGLPYLDAVQFDLDGDGREELCTLTYGPTSGLFTVVFSAYRDGKVIAQNVYNLHYGELYFEKTADGLRLSHTYSQWADSAPQTDIWLVSLKGGRIVWTNEKTGEEFSGYWGDESWNLDGKEPASDDMSEVNVSRTYLCVGATAGDRIVPTPWGYLSELNGLEAVGNDRENAADGFVWVERTYITSVPDGQPKLVWGTLEHFKGDTPAALRLKTDLTDGGEPIVVHFALCDQPMEYGFLDEGIADAGPRLQEPTAETLFYADWDEDGVYEYLTYLKLPETGTCLISDGERTLVLSDCVSVRGFYSDLDSKSPYGNLILSTEAADGSERVYELHPEGDAIVIGAVLNGYCFSADTEERELMLGTPTDLLGAKYGCREVKGEALEPADEWLQASGVIERIMFGKREDNIKDGTLLHLVRALPCEIDGKPATLEPGVYMHLREWNEAMTEIVFLTEDERWITVHLDGTKPYAVGGIPLTDYFDNAPKG